MKNYYLSILVLFLFNYSFSQSLEVSRAEDYRLIKPIIKDSLKSFHVGGEFRLMGQLFNNYNFLQKNAGYPDRSFTRLYHRIFLYSDYKISDNFRIFAQILSSDKWNKNTPTTEIERNDLSFHQLFAEAKISKNALLRIGKQELYFDSERILGIRELPNNRRTTFSVNYYYFLNKNKELNLFYARPFKQNFKTFDDEILPDYFYGINFHNLFPKKNPQYNLMLIYSYQDNIQLLNQVGGDRRLTIDYHFSGIKSKLTYSLESAIQLGKIGNSKVFAGMFLGDLNYRLNEKFSLHYELHGATGDNKTNDSKINTFNTLYSKPFFGQSLSFNIANIISNGIGLNYLANSKHQLGANLINLTILNLEDAIYSPKMTVDKYLNKNEILGNISHSVANAIFINYTYKINANISSILNITYSKPEDYLIRLGYQKFQSFYNYRLTYKF